MKRLIIIGASFHQYPLVQKAKELGFETHVFAWSEGAVAKNIADFFYPISIINKEEILEIAKEIKPNGICSIGSDLANVTVSHIANALGLVANTNDTTFYSTNKHAMREVLKSNNLPIPKFKKVFSLKENDFNFPFLVKTVDRSGSRGITLVYNQHEYQRAFAESLEYSFKDYVILEEYFEGTQYSLETFSQNGNHYFIGLTEEFYTGPPHFVEEKHIMPGRISDQDFIAVKEIIFKSLDALGIKNGAAHSEIRVMNNQYCIIEIASRMGGDFRYKLIELSNGIDYLSMVIKNCVGEYVAMPKPQKDQGAIIKYILNQKDYNDYKNLRKNGIEIVNSEIVNEEIHENVQDSSHRYGYYILECISGNECLNKLKRFQNG
jgi:biotin carboxylase